MADARPAADHLRLRRSDGQPIRVAHLTTIDMSLELLLGTELDVDVEAGLEVIGISAPGPYVSAVEARGVRHVPLTGLTRSWNPRLDASAARELLQTLRHLRVDVLHTHNPKTGVMGRVLGRAAGVPVVVNTCHGLWAGPGDPWKRKLPVYALEMLAAKLSHAELYQNAQDAATISRVVMPRSVEVVGNGTDLRRFVPDSQLRSTFRAHLDVPEDELLVGGVGRLVEEKGIREFGSMATTLAGRATFIWVGPVDSDKRDALRGQLDGVRFIGERSDMPAVYNGLDVFVLPSYREGLSRSAMEAAACGTPLVLSDIRGCREIGNHEQHLLLCPPRDAAGLVEQVGRLLDDPGLRGRLGAAGRARALDEFDQRRIAAASIRTYAEVARRRGLGWQVAPR